MLTIFSQENGELFYKNRVVIALTDIFFLKK